MWNNLQFQQARKVRNEKLKISLKILKLKKDYLLFKPGIIKKMKIKKEIRELEKRIKKEK